MMRTGLEGKASALQADAISATDAIARQNADVHEVVIAELLECAGVATDYLKLGESERTALLAGLLARLGSRNYQFPATI